MGSRTYSVFDESHWLAVQVERARLNLPAHPDRDSLVAEHPLTGKSFLELSNGRAWTVREIRRQWSRGWYLEALLSSGAVERHVVVDADTCHDESVGRRFERFVCGYEVQRDIMQDLAVEPSA